jgi:ectoine hydroxylase-related dioxygenase (phytanoyl-CoA dioxygenase family)
VRITDKQFEQYIRHGYAIVPGFLTAGELAAARAGMLQYFPTAEELAERPQRYGSIYDDPEHLQVEFPFANDALNDVSTHADLIDFVERVLGHNEMLLSQAAIWAKYAGTGDFEQGLHLDYQGNTLVVPREDGDYRQVNMILYYSDVGADLGPTYVVSQEKTAKLPLWPTHRTRKKDAKLYEQERPVLARAGDLFIFGMRTWHRASDITADHGVRFSHHLVWRSARHCFQGYHQWSHMGEKPELQSFIERAKPRQREVLGFPRPDDPYWNDETRATVALRYPKMDMRPYRG